LVHYKTEFSSGFVDITNPPHPFQVQILQFLNKKGCPSLNNVRRPLGSIQIMKSLLIFILAVCLALEGIQGERTGKIKLKDFSLKLKQKLRGFPKKTLQFPVV